MLVYRSFAYFETGKTYNVLEGRIPNFSGGDVTLAVIVDGKKEDTFPDKQSHKYVGYVCNNEDATIEWDKTNWQAIVKTKSPTVCTLKFETAINLDLNGSEPVIKDGLVPVTIANEGTVTKTNVDDTNWYNYDESIWANAVILVGTDTYSVGETIPEEAIESYFVWIPKYRYKLFNVDGNEIPSQEIEIEIGDYDTTNSDTECVATNESGNIGTCSNGKWMTHPAFTSLGVNGFWVGKFETGYKGSTDKASAEVNENAPEKVQIKPNVNSWRRINIGNAYNTSYNYKRSLDSHMMKNIEWGAMAYLTNSKYGRGNNEAAINSNSSYITGCTNNTTYFNNSTGASTTNNYSGIYDTSGGTWDTMMAVYNNTESLSGLTPANISNKYIDRYTGDNVNAKILGDATGETQGWNGDTFNFANSNAPWYYRSGNFDYGSSAGVFSLVTFNGSAEYGINGFRIALSPSN